MTGTQENLQSTHMTDAELIEALAKGGRPAKQAIKVLCEEKGRTLHRYFCYKGATKTEADDILQNVLMKIVDGAKSVREPAAAGGWIKRIADNAFVDHWRREKKHTSEQLPADIENTGGTTPDNYLSLQDCVERAGGKFKSEHPDRAFAISLAVDGFSTREISKELDRTESATRVYLSECRKKFRPYLEPCRELR